MSTPAPKRDATGQAPAGHADAAAAAAASAAPRDEPSVEGAPSAYAPPLLAWIDRVQERVDHLMTLVDAPTVAPASQGEETERSASAAASAPSPAASAGGADLSLAEAWARRLAARERSGEAATADARTSDPRRSSERRQAEPSSADDEPVGPTAAVDDEGPRAADDVARARAFADDVGYEPEPARPSAVLVARELVGRGMAASDVRRQLRDGYGVRDPEAVLALIGG